MGDLNTLQGILIAGIIAQAGALGLVWRALHAKIKHSEAACAEDRKLLHDLLTRVRQIDRRSIELETSPGKL